MSNINNQSENLFAIPGVQELSDKSAAACSGGADVILYSLPGYRGSSLRISKGGNLSGSGRVGRFNNITSSLKVLNGTWRFYKGFNRTGSFLTLSEGKGFRSLGSFDNTISSLRGL